MQLFFRKYGDGHPLVILHGLFGSSDNWVSIARKISSQYTVYLPDQRNHGNSPHDAVHNYKSMSRDLYDLVTSLGIRKFCLAGHSMGGKTAMLFASEWPEMIESLLVADISPFAGNRRKAAARFENLTILEAMINAGLPGAKSRDDVESELAKTIQAEKVKALIMKNLQRSKEGTFEWKLNVVSLLNNLGTIIDEVPFDPGNLPVTGFPVTFLRGEKSDYIRDDEIEQISKLFPAAEFKTIKNAGHWLQADNPDAVTEALLGMVEK